MKGSHIHDCSLLWQLCTFYFIIIATPQTGDNKRRRQSARLLENKKYTVFLFLAAAAAPTSLKAISEGSSMARSPGCQQNEQVVHTRSVPHEPLLHYYIWWVLITSTNYENTWSHNFTQKLDIPQVGYTSLVWPDVGVADNSVRSFCLLRVANARPGHLMNSRNGNTTTAGGTYGQRGVIKRTSDAPHWTTAPYCFPCQIFVLEGSGECARVGPKKIDANGRCVTAKKRNLLLL